MPVLKISSGSNRVLTGNFLNYNRYRLLYRLMEQATASKYITIYYSYILYVTSGKHRASVWYKIVN